MRGRDRASNGARLVVVCGLPGSGKTTRAMLLERRLDAVRLSTDDWLRDLGLDAFDGACRARAEALQWQLARRLLSLGVSVVIEWGTWGRAERDMLRLGARTLGVGVELHTLTAPVDELLDRIQRRRTGVRDITREMLVEWLGVFETPTADEESLFDAPAFPSAGDRA